MAVDYSDTPSYSRRNLKGRAEQVGAEDIPAEALECFELSAEMMDAQRRAILAAKNFRGGNQWPQSVRDQRQGAPAIQGVAAQPARPCLTIDRVSAPVRQVSNVVRQSNFSIEAIPVNSDADRDTADIFNGWIRRVQNESRGDQPVEWAADSAAEGGLGWFAIRAYFTDTDDQFPFDQDCKLDRIANCLSIYPDPFAIRPTRSDMRWLLETEDVPKNEFRERWPKAKRIGQMDAFDAVGDSNGWITRDSYRVALYWKCEYDHIRVVETTDGRILSGKDAEGIEKESIKRERTKLDPKVCWYRVSCCEVLEQGEWAGTRIPYIPVLGEEINIDGQTKLRGVIEPAMDSQRMLNYTFSAAIESAALAPKSPFIYAAGQIERYKNIWQSANTTNYFGLPYDPIDVSGTPVPPPQRNVAEQPIQAFVALMNASEEAIKATTTVFDPSLGNSNPRERSGEAIKALQQQSEFGNSNYQDNVARSMTYAGELLVELGPKILDRPGRILQIMQIDDTPSHVMIGQPFTKTTTGMPQPVNDRNGQPVMDPQLAKIQSGEAKFYDLKGGKYSVVCTVGRDHLTRRKEESAALGELIPHLPPEMQATLTPEYIETLDFSDSRKIADICRRSLPPQLQAAIAPDNPMRDLPPQVQQQLAQIPQLQQALQQAKHIIDTKTVEKQADIERTKLDKTADLLLAHVNNAAKILIAHITAAKEPGNPQDEASLEAQATAIQQAHEAYQNAADRVHEFNMQQQDHQNTLEQNAQEHQQALEQGAQAAALAPQPDTAGASA